MHIKHKIIGIFVLSVQLIFSAANAQETLNPKNAAAQGTSPSLVGVEKYPEATEKAKPIQDYISPKLSLREHILAFAMLIFGGGVLLLQFFQFWRLGSSATAQDILLVYVVTLIVVGTMFLIVVGVSSNQLAPAFGLYGTIVGYLLGRRSVPGSDEHPPNRS